MIADRRSVTDLLALTWADVPPRDERRVQLSISGKCGAGQLSNGLRTRFARRESYRGRDSDCSLPPAQTRTAPIKASGSYLEYLTAKLAVRGQAPVSHEAGTVSGVCFTRPRSSWTPPLAPPAPQRASPRCSSASQLLWRSVTSHGRTSSATAPHLPDADQSSTRYVAVGQP